MNNLVNNVNNFFASLKIRSQKMSNYSGFKNSLFLGKIVIKLFQQVINSFTHIKKTYVKNIMKPKFYKNKNTHLIRWMFFSYIRGTLRYPYLPAVPNGDGI